MPFREFFRTLDQETPHPSLSPRRGNSFSLRFPVTCHTLLDYPTHSQESGVLFPSPGGEGRVRGLFLGIVGGLAQRNEIGSRRWTPSGPSPGFRRAQTRLVHSSRGIGTSQRGGAVVFLFASFSFCEPLWNCGKLRGRIARFPRRPTGKNEGAEALGLCAF